MLRRVTFVDVDRELALSAGALGGPWLRALDAVHVASALRIAAEIEAFVTYDMRQAEAASAAGLTVWTPTDTQP